MAQILIRNLDDASVEHLKRRAHNGRSLQAEAKLVLEQATKVDMARAREMAERSRARLGRRSDLDSADLIRELRDDAERSSREPSIE